MSRPIQVRASYTADASFLSRLLQAVEIDDRKDSKWRKEVITHLQRLIVLFVSPSS